MCQSLDGSGPKYLSMKCLGEVSSERNESSQASVTASNLSEKLDILAAASILKGVAEASDAYSEVSEFTKAEFSSIERNLSALSSLSNLANSFCSCFTNALSDITTLTRALVATCLAHVANKRVFLDCSTWVCAGLIVQMMAVLALPPNECCRMRVSLESL
nr:hypothetical protein Itr_chr15CG03340 [Ipomoea trifida]